MRLKSTLLALCLVASAAAFAQTVSLSKAAQKAKTVFVRSNAARSINGSGANVEPQLAYTSQLAGTTCFYVFNNPEGGYAFIGGDEYSREVLAVVDHGTFDINNIPDGLEYMMKMYAQDIVAAKNGKAQLKKVTPVGSSDVATICQTQWNQQEPYWKNCTTITSANAPKATAVDLNQHTLTGCVATAAAQCIYAMNNRPEGLRSAISYNHDIVDEKDSILGKGTVPQSAPANFKFDWSNMLTTEYNEEGGYNDAQAKAVADFMTVMGICSEMQYGRSSGALPETLQRGLVNYLGIQCKLVDRSSYSDAGWEKACFDELSTGRAICYGGSSDAGGHQFVVDGYKKEGNLFHVNWGWGGQSDGYFALSSASATSAGPGEYSWLYPSQDDNSSGASKEHYRDANSMIINFVYDANNLPALLPAADADGANISSGDGESARSAAGSDIPVFNVSDENCTLKVNFDGDGVKNVGAPAKFVWGVELEPVFEGEEPESYDCYLLSVDDQVVEDFEEGETVSGYSIPVGEYTWAATEEGGAYKYGKYKVTPIMFNDSDGDSDYVEDKDIVYVALPHSWKAPVALFTTPEGINNVNADAEVKTSAEGKVITKQGLTIIKHSKKYNAAGQRM